MAARQNRAAIFLIAVLIFGVVASLVWWNLRTAPPAPSVSQAFSLHPVKFAELDGWSRSDARPALSAFERSCTAILKAPPSQAMTGNGYAGNAGDWVPACKNLPEISDAGIARRFFETNFVPFAIAQSPPGDGLFTGYYEPELRGSKTAHGAYRTPVYGQPDDLIDVDLGQFRESLRGERIAGRLDGHRLVPYSTRAEIDRDGLGHAQVLFYGDDPAAVFFLHIQGSGRVRLDDGSMERVAYAGQNGWPYTSIGRALIEENQLERGKVSMQAIRHWMDVHPAKAREVMERDQSFVFFKEAPVGDPELGSPGAEGAPLTPNASMAVDQRIHPLGAPFYVVANAPDRDPDNPERPLRRLYIAQDIGGAIRGPIRGDLFFGYGKDSESEAGRMKSKGQLYVFVPNAIAARIVGASS
jgi:membrane-bound lytic murein transglycosylase A